MKIAGAVFDLDGTLLDSMFIWDTIGEDYLLNRGITPKPGLREQFKSVSLLQAAEHYQNEYGLTDSVSEIMTGVNQMIDHLYSDVVKPKPGVTHLLELMQQAKIKMCVATATDKYMVEAALKRNGLADYFCGILTCTEIGFGKDNPAIFNAALDLLGTNKKDTLIFEDALYAIKTAKDAGFSVAAIYDVSEQDKQDEIKKIADFYIDSFDEWSVRCDQ